MRGSDRPKAGSENAGAAAIALQQRNRRATTRVRSVMLSHVATARVFIVERWIDGQIFRDVRYDCAPSHAFTHCDGFQLKMFWLQKCSNFPRLAVCTDAVCWWHLLSRTLPLAGQRRGSSGFFCAGNEPARRPDHARPRHASRRLTGPVVVGSLAEMVSKNARKQPRHGWSQPPTLRSAAHCGWKLNGPEAVVLYRQISPAEN